MAKPNPDIEAARLVLLKRAQRQAQRARRARIGSNERLKCLSRANWLSACVYEIDHDKKLAKHLMEVAAAGAGWRAVADAVVTFVRRRDAKKVARA